MCFLCGAFLTENIVINHFSEVIYNNLQVVRSSAVIIKIRGVSPPDIFNASE